jgi:hypothetical protein
MRSKYAREGALRLVPYQFDYSFNMAGLGEHIKGLDAIKVIAAITQQA